MADTLDLEEVGRLVRQSDNIVFFGGAGTSTESGIPDFRSADGLYRSNHGSAHAPEEILSRDFFMRHVEEFYEFYRAKMIYPDARPNPGHRALAEMEKQGKLKAVITQNIDGLHQMAGNRNVLELHGSVHRNRCLACRKHFSLDYIVGSTGKVPRCDACGGIVKPDVVLYQESLDPEVLRQAVHYIERADVLIVAGTSLTVQPAAGLLMYYPGDKLILINKSATPFDSRARYVIRGGFARVMTALAGDASNG